MVHSHTTTELLHIFCYVISLGYPGLLGVFCSSSWPCGFCVRIFQWFQRYSKRKPSVATKKTSSGRSATESPGRCTMMPNTCQASTICAPRRVERISKSCREFLEISKHLSWPPSETAGGLHLCNERRVTAGRAALLAKMASGMGNLQIRIRPSCGV